MGKKKTVMRRVAALLAASLVLTSSAFTSLAAVSSEVGAEEVVNVKMELSQESAEMEVGDTLELKLVFDATTNNAVGYDATASNADAVATNLKWSVDDPEIVSIDPGSDGDTCEVTAQQAGEATVTVTLVQRDSNKPAIEAKCVITVKPAEALTQSPSNLDEILEGLEEEHKAAVEAQVQEQMEAIEDALVELTNTEIAPEAVDGLEAALPEGVDPSSVKLVLDSAKAVATSVKVVGYKDDGTPIVQVVIEKLVYDISLIDVEKGEAVDLSDNEHVMSVTVDLPKKGIDNDANIVKIEHGVSEQEDGSWTWETLEDSAISGEIGVNPTAVIKTTSFSPFELTLDHKDAETNTPPTSSGSHRGSSSGSSSSRSTGASGTWHQDDNGWWFEYTAGGYAANKWELINNKWYYFNESGYAVTGWQLINGQWYYLDTVNCDMQTGWHLDSVDGKWYYLNASGAMATGWVQVNGVYYYLSETATEATYSYDAANDAWVYTNAAARPYGSMYVSETTPDGYEVNADGAWVQ